MRVNILEDIIYPSFDEIRETIDNPDKLKNSIETKLFGEDAALDSLGLVSLIVSIEERIEDITGTSITLADDKAMSRKSSPFKNVSSLAEYIEELLKDDING